MSVESDLLEGLQTLLTPLASAPGTLFQLPPDPDEIWALDLTRSNTEELGRWGLAVLMLRTRGARGEPLGAHGAADPLVRRLIAVSGQTFGTVTVNTVMHRGSAAYVDVSKRTVRTDSFLLDLDYQA